jgi:5'(3')-deoxyribonucleotidase
MNKLLDIYNIIKEEEQTINKNNYIFYCDMDGVLSDFDERFEYFSGLTPKEYELKYGIDKFWDLIDVKIGEGFWSGMNWMKDGKQLWKYIEKYIPSILSAPSKNPQSHLGKRNWIEKHLPNIKLILSDASKKKNYSGKNHILIDDRKKNIDDWNKSGGIGILHTSTTDTINQLQKLGL